VAVLKQLQSHVGACTHVQPRHLLAVQKRSGMDGFWIASASAMAATLFTNPFDVMKVRMQLQGAGERDHVNAHIPFPCATHCPHSPPTLSPLHTLHTLHHCTLSTLSTTAHSPHSPPLHTLPTAHSPHSPHSPPQHTVRTLHHCTLSTLSTTAPWRASCAALVMARLTAAAADRMVITTLCTHKGSHACACSLEHSVCICTHALPLIDVCMAMAHLQRHLAATNAHASRWAWCACAHTSSRQRA
jgi:hypothetical protein